MSFYFLAFSSVATCVCFIALGKALNERKSSTFVLPYLFTNTAVLKFQETALFEYTDLYTVNDLDIFFSEFRYACVWQEHPQAWHISNNSFFWSLKESAKKTSLLTLLWKKIHRFYPLHYFLKPYFRGLEYPFTGLRYYLLSTCIYFTVK